VRLGVSGEGFRDMRLGFGVWGGVCVVEDLEFRVQGAGIKVKGDTISLG